LAALVYYPEDKLKLIKHDFDAKEALNEWYKETIHRMIKLVSYCSSKYTRSKLRTALPAQFAYITEELLYKTEQAG
ncbi:fructose-bisphosphatase class III, partial [Xanthomonas citri pv. citri]|nr:fructose-bisphosphatase class III [Xanthomonas citri pv. citri]